MQAKTVASGPLGLGLGVVLLLLTLVTGLGVDVLVVDSHGLGNLGTQSLIVTDAVVMLANKHPNRVAKVGTYRLTSSVFSISRSMPVILPAKSGWMAWILGKMASPSSCFC